MTEFEQAVVGAKPSLACQHGQLARSCEICDLIRERDEVVRLATEEHERQRLQIVTLTHELDEAREEHAHTLECPPMVEARLTRERDEALGTKRVALQLADDLVRENKTLRALLRRCQAELFTGNDVTAFAEDAVIKRKAQERDRWHEEAVNLRERLTRERDEAREAYRNKVADVGVLRAALQEAEDERDEARAEVANLRAALDSAEQSKQNAVGEAVDAIRERDEARARETAIGVAVRSLADDRDLLRALLREVEWAGDGTSVEHTGCCLWCHAHNGDGHAPDCRLSAALKGHDD